MSTIEIKIQQNDNSQKIPIIQLPVDISQAGLVDRNLIKISQDLFRDNGVLQIDNLFSQELVKNLALSFQISYRDYFDNSEYADSLEIGDKRRMISVEVKDAFNNPQLWANLFILNLMQKLLGEHFILGSFGVVISLPGAVHQHIHRDHPPLFNDEAIDSQLPSFAITVVVPLVDLTEATGSTRVWKKSHRQKRSQRQRVADSYVPLMNRGSCYLMDYQLVHGGTPNTSNIVRPLLYLIYYRSWFREIVNFEKQSRIAISATEYQKIPDGYKFLFAGLNHNTQKVLPPNSVERVSISNAKFTEVDTYNQEQRLLQLAKKALVDYGLENAKIELITHRENTTFCIEIPHKAQKTEANTPYLTNRYLLRIHRGNYLSPEAVVSELQWLQALRHDSNLPVPEPVTTLRGELVTVVEAPGIPTPRVCSLMRWVYGEENKPMNLKNIGKLIGQLHNHSSQWQPPIDFTRPSWNWNGLFGEGAGYSINNGNKIWQLTPQPYRQLFREVGDRLKEVMNLLGEDKEQFGLIHGDLCPGNLLAFYNEIRPIDFADCGYGYWVQDIAMFINYFARNPQVPKYLTQLLKGYKEVRPLPVQQLVYIDTFIAIHQVTLTLWRVNRAQDHPYFRSILASSLQEAAQHARWFLEQYPLDKSKLVC